MLNNSCFKKIDHIAIAVLNFDKSIKYYTEMLGFKLDCIRDTKGENSSMRSAVLMSGDFTIVLIYSLSENSQVNRYIETYGPGIQHVAFLVDDVEDVYEKMKKNGVEFATGVIIASGLKQAFTKRDSNTGMMHEIIERGGVNVFDESNINELFKQLEKSDQF